MDNPCKTPFLNGKRQFPPSLHQILKSCALIKAFESEGIDNLITIIIEYTDFEAVLFGDVITIQSCNNKNFLDVGERNFKIVSCDQKCNANDKMAVHFGENFMLQSCIGKNKYLQRSKMTQDDRNVVHKTVRFDTEMIHITTDTKYKQTLQFDIANSKVMGNIVRYDKQPTGITFGGNYAVEHTCDHLNPDNDFRTWLSLGTKFKTCVVSWWLSCEKLYINKVTI
eukprot:254580_1